MSKVDEVIALYDQFKNGVGDISQQEMADFLRGFFDDFFAKYPDDIINFGLCHLIHDESGEGKNFLADAEAFSPDEERSLGYGEVGAIGYKLQNKYTDILKHVFECEMIVMTKDKTSIQEWTNCPFY